MAKPPKNIKKNTDKPQGYSKQDLEKFRVLLSDLRKRVARGLEHMEEQSLNKSQRDAAGDLSGYSLHMADVATDNFDLEFNIGLASNEQQSLNLIDNALRRIDDGTFGICQTCSKLIPQKRLTAMPVALMCIKCQEEEEKRVRRSS